VIFCRYPPLPMFPGISGQKSAKRTDTPSYRSGIPPESLHPAPADGFASMPCSGPPPHRHHGQSSSRPFVAGTQRYGILPLSGGNMSQPCNHVPEKKRHFARGLWYGGNGSEPLILRLNRVGRESFSQGLEPVFIDIFPHFQQTAVNICIITIYGRSHDGNSTQKSGQPEESPR
jgi:hypothetical protein